MKEVGVLEETAAKKKAEEDARKAAEAAAKKKAEEDNRIPCVEKLALHRTSWKQQFLPTSFFETFMVSLNNDTPTIAF